jgi:murein DD-endopeptidase MepM/ murein hydrolase activator NlpD
MSSEDNSAPLSGREPDDLFDGDASREFVRDGESEVSVMVTHPETLAKDRDLWRDLSRFFLLFAPLFALGLVMIAQTNTRLSMLALEGDLVFRVLLRQGVSRESAASLAVDMELAPEWRDARVVPPTDLFENVEEIRDWLAREGRESVSRRVPHTIDVRPERALQDSEALFQAIAKLRGEAIVDNVFADEARLGELGRLYRGGLRLLGLLKFVFFCFCLVALRLGRKIAVGADDPLGRLLLPGLAGIAAWLALGALHLVGRYGFELGGLAFLSFRGSLALALLGLIIGPAMVLLRSKTSPPGIPASILALCASLAVLGPASRHLAAEIEQAPGMDFGASIEDMIGLQRRIEETEREMIFFVDWVHSRTREGGDFSREQRMNQARLDIEERKTEVLSRRIETHNQRLGDLCEAAVQSRTLETHPTEPSAERTLQALRRRVVADMLTEFNRENSGNWTQLKQAQTSLVHLRRESVRHSLNLKYSQMKAAELEKERARLHDELQSLYKRAGKSPEDGESLALLFFKELADSDIAPERVETPKTSPVETVNGPGGGHVRPRRDSILWIPVSPGGAVRAVRPGRTLYAGDFFGMGKIVVLSHGETLSGVYGGLGLVQVQVGASVRQGQSVGLARVVEGSEQSLVRFEVRENGLLAPSRALDGLESGEIGRLIRGE